MTAFEAIKERAERDGLNLKPQSDNTLKKLLRIALELRWLLDASSEVPASAAPSPMGMIRLRPALGRGVHLT